MKKYLISFAVLALGMASVTSCSDDDDNNIQLALVGFEGSYFSDFVCTDAAASNLYNGDEYKWTDPDTKLSGECIKANWGEYGWGWTNGPAISKYVDSDASHGSYSYQLAVPKSNGSNNFAVIWDNGSQMSFADNKARVIRGLQVMNTLYAIESTADIGDGKKHGIKYQLGNDYSFVVKITGINGELQKGTVTVDLAKGNEYIQDWKNVDLTSLGPVTKLIFTFDGSDKISYDGGVTYYLNTPAYVAIDNIVVEK